MAKIARSLTELIGNTPLLELSNFERKHKLGAKILAKLEYFNPAGSVKDRIGYAMIKAAEDQGLLNKDRPGDHVIRSEEHTSELQSRENLVCRLLLEKKKK